MNKWELNRKVKDTSKKLFGQEDSIVMSVKDVRYRYYQWLRSWFGLREKTVTHKCPFYQFLFWGSLLMIASFPFFIVANLILLFSKVIGVIFPFIPNILKEAKKSSPIVFSFLVPSSTIITITLLFMVFSINFLLWFGFVIHFIFGFPVGVIILLWKLLVWLGGLLGTFFSWIWSLLVAVNWGLILYVFGMGMLYLLGIAVAVWLLYRVALFLFNRGCFNILIKKSCEYREKRQKRNNEKLAKQIEEKRLAKQKLIQQEIEYNLKHKKENEEKEKRMYESLDKWFKILNTIFKSITWPIGKLFWLVAMLFVGIWFLIKKVGEIFYVIWHMITSTVGNHCPPIDFIETFVEEGTLHKTIHGLNAKRYIYIFEGKDEYLNIEEEQFPKNFKSKAGKNKVVIDYNIIKGYRDYNRYRVAHSINSIKYLSKSKDKK